MGKVESPTDPPETDSRKKDVRFTGFRVLLGNMRVLTQTPAAHHTHWESVGAGGGQILTIPEKTERWASHMLRGDSYLCISHSEKDAAGSADPCISM